MASRGCVVVFRSSVWSSLGALLKRCGTVRTVPREIGGYTMGGRVGESKHKIFR